MKLMREITVDFLNEKKSATFNEIWEHIKETLSSEWSNSYKAKEDEINKIKIGELYLMLTAQGEFIRKADETWSLVKFYSFEELRRMKINVVAELED